MDSDTLNCFLKVLGPSLMTIGFFLSFGKQGFAFLVTGVSVICSTLVVYWFFDKIGWI